MKQFITCIVRIVTLQNNAVYRIVVDLYIIIVNFELVRINDQECGHRME